MTLDEAIEINTFCVETFLGLCVGIGPGAGDGSFQALPDNLTLEDMCHASAMVEREVPLKDESGVTKLRQHVSPRGLALIYAFQHHGADVSALLGALGFQFKCAACGAE